MKAGKIIVSLILAYVGIVVAFESMIGFFQPGGDGTLVITTTNEAGESNSRVLARLESNGQLYVAANHWPRAWYNQALANPNVQVGPEGEREPHVAVPATDAESDRVHSENNPGVIFRIVTGFPPRYFLRLDPQ